MRECSNIGQLFRQKQKKIYLILAFFLAILWLAGGKKGLNSAIEKSNGQKNSGEHPRFRWDSGLATSPYGLHRIYKLS